MVELLAPLVALVTALVGVWQTYAARQSVQSRHPGAGVAETPTLSEPLPSPAAQSKLVMGSVLRDAGVIFTATLVLGGIIGFASADSTTEELILTLAAVNIVLLLVGFTISATFAPHNRWSHLAAVAAAIWVLSLINVVLGVVSFGAWFAGGLLTAVLAVVAGGLSYVFRRD